MSGEDQTIQFPDIGPDNQFHRRRVNEVAAKRMEFCDKSEEKRFPAMYDRVESVLMKQNKYLAALYALIFMAIPVLVLTLKDRLYLDGCIFKKMTGLACPGCGIRRSLDALVQCDIVSSLKNYPPLPFMILFFFILGIMLVHEKATGRAYLFYLRGTTILAFIIIVLVISNWIINNLLILHIFAR